MLLALALGGCPMPEQAFDDFVARVPDAPVVIVIDAPPLDMIPDITGSALVGLQNQIITNPIQLIATQTLTQTPGAGGTLEISVQALDKTTREPVGAIQALDTATVTVGGEFVATKATLMIPAAANTAPVPGDIVANNVVLRGRIFDEDFHCGTVEGTTSAPVVVDLMQLGTTYASKRVPPGTTGAALPPVEAVCRPVPDAGP